MFKGMPPGHEGGTVQDGPGGRQTLKLQFPTLASTKQGFPLICRMGQCPLGNSMYRKVSITLKVTENHQPTPTTACWRALLMKSFEIANILMNAKSDLGCSQHYYVIFFCSGVWHQRESALAIGEGSLPVSSQPLSLSLTCRGSRSRGTQPHGTLRCSS